MSKKETSTFEREMKNVKLKGAFEKGYKEFLISELLIEIMENDEKLDRKLIEELMHLYNKD